MNDESKPPEQTRVMKRVPQQTAESTRIMQHITVQADDKLLNTQIMPRISPQTDDAVPATQAMPSVRQIADTLDSTENRPAKKIPPTDDAPPRYFGKYKIIDELGSGSMGVVYRCHDPHIDREVAIKTVYCKDLSSQARQEILDRFNLEIKAVGRLSHPNIVPIYESGEQDGAPYFVMAYIKGDNLDVYLKQHTCTIDAAIQIMQQVLAALDYSHSQGIIHRDLKPANLFMDEVGNIKLSDFGIAKIEDTEYTVPGTILGTLNYMSPEQCQGQNVDARSDLFSCAVLFYELLTNEKCFSAQSAFSVMQNIIQLKPVKPSELNLQISPTIDAIITKAMAKHPADRYQTAVEFQHALKNARHGTKTKRISRKTILAMLLFLMLGAGTTTWLLFLREPQPTPVDTQPVQTQLALPTQEKVQRLLRVAQAHQSVGRLVAPQGGNAYDAYQLVLRLDQRNAQAQAGLTNVADALFERCHQLSLENDDESLLFYLSMGIKLFPKDPRFAQLKETVR